MGKVHLNLVHVLPYYAPAWSFGGVVRAAYGLTTALARQGHHVTVVTTDAGDNGRIAEREAYIDGVHAIRCPNLLPALHRHSLSTPQGMNRVLGSLLTDADALHVHEFRTIENLIALPAARRCRVPAVLSPHGTLGYEAGRSRAKMLWDRLLGYWSAQQIGRVAALTADEASDARGLWNRLGLGLGSEQVVVVPNGVNLEEFAALPDRSLFRRAWDVPVDAPLILFLGRLHGRKGVHHLIAALSHLSEAWLAVVGPDEGQGEMLRALAQRSGVASRVIFTGLLTGADKLMALAGADLLALPAIGEGLPMVALEAMAAGLPVALSDGCHLPEVVEAGAGVHLPTLTGEAIASAVAPVLGDEKLRKQMGDAGRHLVKGRFTWDAVAQETVRVYQEARV